MTEICVFCSPRERSSTIIPNIFNINKISSNLCAIVFYVYTIILET